MIINEVRMANRKEQARGGGRKVSLDTQITDDSSMSLGDILAAEEVSPEEIDADWQKAVLQSAVEHVLTRTALSPRDRDIYRDYVQKGVPIEQVAKKFGMSKNSVSQVKTRIERRIVAFGRELVERESSAANV
jgi:RNA polymerase sigma factor (sigma-70 family)